MVSVKEEEDLSSHSSMSGSSASVYSEDDHDLEERGVESSTSGDLLNTKPVVKSKTARGLKLAAAVVGVMLVLLAVDIFLLFRMEFKIKTIDGVLSDDSPEANVQLSFDVPSRLLFSTIQVNSFKCQAFHKAPYDDENGQYFAEVTNNNGFETKKMIDQQSPNDNVIDGVDLLISNIDFDILKRAMQDSYMTINQTATRLDCSFNSDVNVLGMGYVSAPTVTRKFERRCDDCDGQQEFDSTDIFMAAVVGSLLSDTNTPSSENGDETYKRSISFSENSDSFTFNVNKEFDISGAMCSIERFNLQVPSVEYVIVSKDRDEFWTTTSTPFSVDLAAPGATRLVTDITTSCANSVTGSTCHVTDPANNFLNDVWNGNINYEMSTSAQVSKDPSFGDKKFEKMNSPGPSDVASDDNFVESLFGINFEVDMSVVGEAGENIGDFESNIKDLNTNAGDVGGLSRILTSTIVRQSVVLKLRGGRTDLVSIQVDYASGWPGHPGGGMTNIHLNFYDGEVIIHADVNASPDDMHAVIRSFEVPSQGFKAVDGNIEVYLNWHDNTDDRKVTFDYIIDWDGDEQLTNTVTVGYGDIIADWSTVADLGMGLGWTSMGHSADDDEITSSDGGIPQWRCKKLTHDDKDGSVVFCYCKGSPRFKLTYYDDDKKEPSIKLAGAFDGTIQFLVDILPYINNGIVNGILDIIQEHDKIDLSVNGAIVIRDDNLFKFVTFKSFRMQSMLSRYGVDLFMNLHDRDDNEVVLVRAMTGWESFYSITDMGVTTTQFLFRTDGYEHLRVDMAEAYVRYEELTDMNMAIDRLSVVIADKEVVDTTVKVKYINEAVNVILRLFVFEDDIIYLNIDGKLHLDSPFNWDVEMKKILLRLGGKERIKATMSSEMMEVDDASNDMHMGMSMQMDLSVNEESFINVQNMHMNVIMNNDTENVYLSSNMRGIFLGEDVFNGTFYVERDASDWIVSTNGFDVAQPFVQSQAPSLAPTAYAYTTKTVVEVDTDVKFKTTKNSFENDDAAQNAATSAFKKSMNETNAKVSIDDIVSEFTETRRRRLEVVESIVVTFKTTVVAERTGQSSSDLYSRMKNSISTAVSSGTFESALETAFEEFDVSETFTAERTVVVAPAVVTVENVSTDSGGSDSGMSTTIIAIIVVVIAIGLVSLVGAYFFFTKSKDSRVDVV